MRDKLDAPERTAVSDWLDMVGRCVNIPSPWKWNAPPPREEVEDFEGHLCGASCAVEWLSKNLLG